MRLKENKRGFTLVEVMIALLILSITLIALTGSQGVSLNSTRKAKFITLGTIVAKNMLEDIDIMADVRGFDYIKELGEKTEGDFDDEQYQGWKWVREVKEVNIPISELIKTFTGKQENEETSGGEQKTTSSQEEQILSMIGTNIEKLMKDSMREVTVTVLWPVKAGKDFSSVKLVYYVVDIDGVQRFVPLM
ncbi:MAG: prepilin-type N-terminal cleavage/methylation domain-containing protein [Pseudomonadota bacterium]